MGYSADSEKALNILPDYGYTAAWQNYVREWPRDEQIMIPPLYEGAAVKVGTGPHSPDLSDHPRQSETPVASRLIAFIPATKTSSAESASASAFAALTTTSAGTSDTTPLTASSTAPVATDLAIITTTTSTTHTASSATPAADATEKATKQIEPPAAGGIGTDEAEATDRAERAGANDYTTSDAQECDDTAAPKEPNDAPDTSAAQQTVPQPPAALMFPTFQILQTS